VKRAKLSTIAPPPIARNPSTADGMTPQWLKNHRVSDSPASEALRAFDDATSEPLGSCCPHSKFHRCLMGFARTMVVF
jgi:hypothetical protein